MKLMPWIGLLLAATTACGSGPSSSNNVAPTPVQPESAAVSTSPDPLEPVDAPSSLTPTMNGNAATNTACKLLSPEQVTTLSGLAVTGLLGLPAQGAGRAGTSESCTWFLDSQEIQASLVVQYTLYPKPPADLLAYYPTVVKQGLGKRVPKLGDYSKIDSAVLDTIDRRAVAHVTLRLHYPQATAEDQARSIAVMRLVLAGLPR